VADPSSTAILTDFDGTLAPIITDPAAVRPLPGIGSTLNRLASQFGLVAVVSGRPVAFLSERLAVVDEVALVALVALVGLYGLERSGARGEVIVEPEAEKWRPVVEHAARRLKQELPADVTVESKGLTVAVHWRSVPAMAGIAAAAAERVAASTGLKAHPGRMNLELRPPMDIDKGSAVGALVRGYSAACFVGDDLGDLPAFAALDRASAAEGISTVTIAAVDDESPPEMEAAADVVVSGPQGALDVLTWLADHAADSRR
jgi:trehalose 6-phosphate phosphatase